jgi:nucleotide-binding universal stress UspA family protein
MFKKILVPTDGSPLSELAARAAVDFAAASNAAIIAFSVAEAYPYPLGMEGGVVPDLSGYEDALRENARRHVQQIANAAEAAKVPCESMVVVGYAAGLEITEAAKNKACDLIWMASHGRTGLQRMFMGSQTQKVLANAGIPVLVYPVNK